MQSDVDPREWHLMLHQLNAISPMMRVWQETEAIKAASAKAVDAWFHPQTIGEFVAQELEAMYAAESAGGAS
jgi:hypothetical protein